MKRTTVIIMILALVSIIAFGAVSLAATKTMKFMVFTKEKTVLADGVLASGVRDLEYKIERNKTITSSKEGVYYSYQGDAVSGTITAAPSSEVLCRHHEARDSFTIDYYLSRNDKVTRYEFIGAKITGMKATGSGDGREVVYAFESAGFREHK